MHAHQMIGRRLADVLIERAREGLTEVVDVGNVFFRMAADRGGDAAFEVTGNRFLPPKRQLDAAACARMRATGFNEPDDEWPNWWLMIEGGKPAGMTRAATLVVRALTEVFGENLPDLAEQLGFEVTLPSATLPRFGQPADDDARTPTPAQAERPQAYLDALERIWLEALRT